MAKGEGNIVAIVGAGFCGTMAAVHLLRSKPLSPLRIILIDSRDPGRGLAYGTPDQKHLLNVPSGGMSAFESEPTDFVRYLQGHYGPTSGNEFVPRFIYGDYLKATLNAAIAGKPENIDFNFVRARATDIQEHTANSGEKSRYEIALDDGTPITAHKIILATGNTAPKKISLRNSGFLQRSLRYINDPWSDDLLDRVDWQKPLLLIGTGLTAVDIAIKLNSHQFQPTIYAISRHGLQPIAHRGLSGKLPAIDLPQLPARDSPTLASLMRLVRGKAAEIVADDRDWRDVIAALRPKLPQIWQQLSHVERARFLRHCNAYWDVHRHRIAPPVAAWLQDLMVSRRLIVMAGRITALRENGDCVEAHVRIRGKQQSKKLAIGTVINCTGPGTDVQTIEHALTRALLRRGILRGDALKLGIEVGSDYGARGPALPQSIYYAGPWLKAMFWEATAVPELRIHIRNVVDTVFASLPNREPGASFLKTQP